MDDILIKDFNKKKLKNLTKNVVLFFGFLVIIAYYLFSAPFTSKDNIIHISTGQSIDSISKYLEDNNSVRNSYTLNTFVYFLKNGNGVISGDYLIKKNSPVWVVAWQISRGHHNIKPIKVTIREGLTNEQIATLLEDKLVGFRKDLFLENVLDKQGYLFPDTYFFFPLDTPKEIVEKLSNNFETKIKKLSNKIELSGVKLSDVIIMASILEGEANGEKDINIISNILWKRISLDMPLQVDVDRFTYINKGLPTSPLNNPGLASIKAAMNKDKTPYLYYLHEKNGNVHYATSFEEHKKNISKYLK